MTTNISWRNKICILFLRLEAFAVCGFETKKCLPIVTLFQTVLFPNNSQPQTLELVFLG